MNQDNSMAPGAMPDRMVMIDHEPFLFFSGTAYLCMNRNAAFTSLIQEGMQLYGTNYGSSRTGNFRLPVYEKAELVMAQKMGAEAALTLSSGYMAAQLVIRHFDEEFNFLYAPDCHPALWRNPSDFYTGSFTDWKQYVIKRIADEPNVQFILVCNSIDPLRLNPYEFSWLGELQSNHPVVVILDDSHGMGVTGKEGNGIYQSLKSFGQIEPIVVSSLAKAMGLPGGLILASEVRMQNFRRSPYYTAASPMAPAYLHAYLHADAIYEEERTHLYNSIKYFREHLGQIKGIRSLSDYPVFACSHSGLAEYLYQRKILISSFSYPKPTDDVITRIILNSHHTQSDLDQLLHALHDNPHTVHDK